MVVPHVGRKVAKRPESSLCIPMLEISQDIVLSEKEARCSRAHVDYYFVFKRGKNKNLYWNCLVFAVRSTRNVSKQLIKEVCYGEGVGCGETSHRTAFYIALPFDACERIACSKGKTLYYKLFNLESLALRLIS